MDKFSTIVSFLIIVVCANAQQLVLNDGFRGQYIHEAVLPVSSSAYVLAKDSIAYLYNTTGILPYKTKKLKDCYVLNTVENKLYTIRLVPQFADQLDDETQQLTTLVNYVYVLDYSRLDSVRTDELVKQYGYLIPKTAIEEGFTFNETASIEDTYATIRYQDDHLSLPSHYALIDKNKILAVHRNGNLVLSETKNHKVAKEETWTNFNGDISIVSCAKIGDIVRVNFQRYQQESDTLESFWSIINLENQRFVTIDLKDFNANLEKLQEQDLALLNSVPFFYKSLNNNNITLFVLPHKNYVWVDDNSYYYGSDDLSKYATMQKEDNSYSLSAHAYLYNNPSRILRAIAPLEKDKIKALEETYVRNKHEIISQRCKE